MGGLPVWLASLSRRGGDGKIIPVSRWSQDQLDSARGFLYEAVGNRGNQDMERLFRMNVTLCLHRALSEDEMGTLPADWSSAPTSDIAGIPVEILYEKGIPDVPSTRPCAEPGRMQLPGTSDPDLWIPVGCGRCESCRARADIGGSHIPYAP